MHDLFGGLMAKALNNPTIRNNFMHDIYSSMGEGAKKAWYGANRARLGGLYSKPLTGQALTDANIAFSKEILQNSAVKNARNWMIGGAAYGGVTGANRGRRDGSGMIRGGIGGALRGGAMGFGGARGYAMFGHKVPNGWKTTAGSWKPFGL